MQRTSVFVLCGLLMLAAVTATAQIVKGGFVGTVIDHSGAVVPGAGITVTNLNTGVRTTSVTDSAGSYNVPFLDPGNYSLSADSQGFKVAVESNVKLDIASKVRVNFTLEVGSQGQTVSVSGVAPLIQTDTATVNQIITGEKLDQIPLLGRDYQALAQLSPTAVAPTQNMLTTYKTGTLSAGNYYQVAGQRGAYISYTTDGVENQDVWFQSQGVIPPLDSIQEFDVQISNVPAEYGRGVVQFTTTTRQGTNAVHGSLYEYLQNNVLDANDFFSNQTHTPRQPFQENQYGATVGGPIRKNRAFFFAGYEGHRHNQATPGYANWPDSQWLQGDFSNLLGSGGSNGVIYDPATTRLNADGVYVRDPFPGNQIPASRINPVAANVVAGNYIPAPNAPGVLPGENYEAITRLTQSVDQGVLRIDYDLSKHDQIYGRYLQSNESDLSTALSPLSQTSAFNDGINVMVGDTHTFSASLLNELRLGYNRANYLPYQEGSGGSINYTAQLGIKNLTTNPLQFGLPNFSWGGYTGIGGTADNPLGGLTDTYQLSDNLIKSFGNHSIKTGIDFRKTLFIELASYGARGVFSFSNNFSSLPSDTADTGNPFADFLLGLSTSAAGLFGDTEARLNGTIYSGYIQDDWRATRRLTLNIGLRYENYRPWAERNGNISRWDPGMVPGSCFGSGCPAGSFIPTGPGNSWYNPQNNDWGPRFGFSYSPFGNSGTVIRGAYGLFYSPTDTNEYVNGILDPPNALSFSVAPENIYTDLSTTLLSNLFPGGVLPPQNQVLSTANWTLPSVSPYPFIANNKDAAVSEWSFGVQHSLGANNVVEVGYIGSHGVHGQIRINYNQSRLDYPGQLTTIASRAPYPVLGVFATDEHSATNSYNAGYIRAERRFSRGYSLVAAYTWAKTMDDADFYEPPAQNAWNKPAEWGLALFDVRNRFTLGYVWQLPFGRGQQYGSNVNRALDEVIGGWQLSGITTFQSGSPFTVYPCCVDYSNTGQYDFGLRPNINGPVKYLNPRKSGNLWFDPSVFSVPAFGTFGDASRGVTVGPGINNWDITVSKYFAITERIKLQFRSEMFNAFNHTQFSMAGYGNLQPIGPGVPTQGTVNSTLPPRHIQLSLRLQY